MAQIDYGKEIRERFPDHSQVHQPGNPGKILIEEGIGPEFEGIEEAIFGNSLGRFLENAEGEYLDMYGDWFGIHRDGRTDEEYKNVLMIIRTADCTIHGVKVALAALLGINISQITIFNTYSIAESNPESRHQNYFDFGDEIDAERPSDNPNQYWRGHNSAVSTKSMTIQIPTGSGKTAVENFMPRLTVPNVTVTVVEV